MQPLFQVASVKTPFVSRSDSAIRSLFQELSSDDQSLYFGSAFINAQGARVAVQAFDDGAADQAGAAVNLYGVVDDAAGGFGGEEFCLARFSGRRLNASVLRVCG